MPNIKLAITYNVNDINYDQQLPKKNPSILQRELITLSYG